MGGVLPFSKRTCEIAVRTAWAGASLSVKTVVQARRRQTHLADKVLGEVGEVVLQRDVFVREEVLVLGLWCVAVAKKYLEEMEQPDEAKLVGRTLGKKYEHAVH